MIRINESFKPQVEYKFNLLDYAHEHRLRTRNLHDGNPVPDLGRSKQVKKKKGYRGEQRYDAIIGQDGYVAQGDDSTTLATMLFYKSAKGVNSAVRQLKIIGATINQVGDTELSATAPTSKLSALLDVIKVKRIALRNPSGTTTPGFSDRMGVRLNDREAVCVV